MVKREKGIVGRPEIFSYLDYRVCLNDWIAYLQSERRGYSSSRVARDSGLSPSALSRALHGERGFSDKTWNAVLQVLGFKKEEREFLSTLRTLCDSSEQSIRLSAFDRLMKFRGFRDRHPEVERVHQYLTHWYYVAIREMAALPDFKLDLTWIQKRLIQKVSLPEIRKAINFLRETGLIQVSKDGKVKIDSGNIRCEGPPYKVALTEFHRELLHLASGSLESSAPFDKHLIGRAVAIPDEKMPEVREILEEAREKIKALENSHNQKPENVKFIYLMSFPLTKSEVGHD